MEIEARTVPHGRPTPGASLHRPPDTAVFQSVLRHLWSLEEEDFRRAGEILSTLVADAGQHAVNRALEAVVLALLDRLEVEEGAIDLDFVIEELTDLIVHGNRSPGPEYVEPIGALLASVLLAGAQCRATQSLEALPPSDRMLLLVTVAAGLVSEVGRVRRRPPKVILIGLTPLPSGPSSDATITVGTPRPVDIEDRPLAGLFDGAMIHAVAAPGTTVCALFGAVAVATSPAERTIPSS